MATIEALLADITTLEVDAIVNAANVRVLGGGGVDGAIHAAAGPELLEECLKLPQIMPGVRCLPGDVVVTGAYDLPCSLVFHTVGPVWEDGNDGEDEILTNCYRNALLKAQEVGIYSIAFPAISTGTYGFPPKRAARLSIAAIKNTLPHTPKVERVVLCCFDDESYDNYRALLQSM